MKKFMTGLLKGRKMRWTLVAVALAAVGLSLAWTLVPQYKLGGGFIGSPAHSGGMWWSAVQTPLDPAGKTAALRVCAYSLPEPGTALLAFCGADTLGDGVGQVAMISNDTAKGRLVFYAVKNGNPSLGIPQEVKAIWVGNYLLKFTSADAYDVTGELFIYSAAADANGDGLPDPGAEPLLPEPIPVQYSATRLLP